MSPTRGSSTAGLFALALLQAATFGNTGCEPSEPGVTDGGGGGGMGGDGGASAPGDGSAGASDAGIGDSGTPPFDGSTPPMMSDYCNRLPDEWPAGGTIRPVRPGDDLQAAIDAADPGDTIEFQPGEYDVRQGGFTVRRSLRLLSPTPHAAVFLAGKEPQFRGDGGEDAELAIFVRDTDDVLIDGLEIRYAGFAIYAQQAENVVVQRSRFVSNYGNGVRFRDVRNPEVRCSVFLDPLLPGDLAGTVTYQTTGPGGELSAHMDYAISLFGTIGAHLHHNYFHGSFNQTLSFKGGNVDGRAEYNTFEGFNLTALFFGQERGDVNGGPYPRTGLPDGIDHGTMKAIGNVFRPTTVERPDPEAAQRGRTPIRVWHVDGDVEIAYNVIEASLSGITLECDEGSTIDCAKGRIIAHHNLVNGSVIDRTGSERTIGACGIDLQRGLLAAVELHHETYANNRTGVCGEGVVGGFTITSSELYQNDQAIRGSPTREDYNNFWPDDRSGKGASSTNEDPELEGGFRFELRDPRVHLEPDRSFTEAFTPRSGAPGIGTGEGGSTKGALDAR